YVPVTHGVRGSSPLRTAETKGTFGKVPTKMKITPVRNLSGRGEILSIPHLVSPPPSLSTFHLSPFHPSSAPTSADSDPFIFHRKFVLPENNQYFRNVISMENVNPL
uniref:hypothetical protein n=1 Tax=Alistipes shahii TaxID=328814 RepID=UPI00307EF703